MGKSENKLHLQTLRILLDSSTKLVVLSDMWVSLNKLNRGPCSLHTGHEFVHVVASHQSVMTAKSEDLPEN